MEPGKRVPHFYGKEPGSGRGEVYTPPLLAKTPAFEGDPDIPDRARGNLQMVLFEVIVEEQGRIRTLLSDAIGTLSDPTPPSEEEFRAALARGFRKNTGIDVSIGQVALLRGLSE
jgi:hypothetical protein